MSISIYVYVYMHIYLSIYLCICISIIIFIYSYIYICICIRKTCLLRLEGPAAWPAHPPLRYLARQRLPREGALRVETAEHSHSGCRLWHSLRYSRGGGGMNGAYYP